MYMHRTNRWLHELLHDAMHKSAHDTGLHMQTSSKGRYIWLGRYDLMNLNGLKDPGERNAVTL